MMTTEDDPQRWKVPQPKKDPDLEEDDPDIETDPDLKKPVGPPPPRQRIPPDPTKR